jgi:nucleoside 2-deoxyribosyltransferase
MMSGIHRLSGHLIYLAGPMDDSPDRGQGWRGDTSKFLKRLGIGVLNPCDNPVINALNENDKYYEEISRLKQLGDFDAVKKLAKRIVGQDLHLIDLCSAVILFIDKDVHMCGSYAEQTYACLEHKPLIICCKQGKAAIPNFIFGMGISDEMMFSDWESVHSYILKVCYDEAFPGSERWRFIDFRKVFWNE